MNALHVVTMYGLGDNIYSRPVVRDIAGRRPVWLETPWPEIYEDLPVRFVRPRPTKLRTQTRNMDRQPARRWDEPRGETVTLRYDAGELAHGSILRALEIVLPPAGPLEIDLPDPGPSPVLSERPIAVVRPVTVRREWMNPARNPLPEYVTEAAAHLRAAGYHVVSVADLEPDVEWLVGEAPPADTVLHAGELHVSALLALVQRAAVCVGGVGWLAPAALAAGTSLVVIAGGHGAYNAPEMVMDPRMDTSRVRWLVPDRYCRCRAHGHDCDKTISDFGARFSAALREVMA